VAPTGAIFLSLLVLLAAEEAASKQIPLGVSWEAKRRDLPASAGVVGPFVESVQHLGYREISLHQAGDESLNQVAIIRTFALANLHAK